MMSWSRFLTGRLLVRGPNVSWEEDGSKCFSMSNSIATFLPAHGTYSMAIKLLPGRFLPKGIPYLCRKSRQWTPTSRSIWLQPPFFLPARTVLFFVCKKDGTLQPCIDDKGVRNITVRNRYPLPLMCSAFELLQGAKVFSMLDLRSAYNLIWVRWKIVEWKTTFNTPSSHYEYFLVFGLTNCPTVFHCLINDSFF